MIQGVRVNTHSFGFTLLVIALSTAVETKLVPQNRNSSNNDKLNKVLELNTLGVIGHLVILTGQSNLHDTR